MRYSTAALFGALLATAEAGSLKDIKHVVMFMQENRAFDHYYGTMAGVRGFDDPNIQVNPDGRTTYQQLVPDVLANKTASMYTNTTPEADRSLTMWHLGYLGGTWKEVMQCSGAGSNSWQANHATLNNGLNNLWAVNNTYMSWAYHDRSDIPYHFSLAENYMICDMYQEGVIASTEPNRVHWMTGSINAPGSPSDPDAGGTVIDNNGTPGCELGPRLGCYPFSWKTFPEYLEEAGVTWQVYQGEDNFGDNALASFTQFQNAPPNSSLAQRGNSFPGLQKFYDDAMEGNLPEVSYIVGPAQLSEHNPYMPKDGAWLVNNIVESVVTGASANDTALFIMYDETGGWGDHVIPFHSPEGTTAEWMDDPWQEAGYVYTGPGFRVPMHIISPWTRGQKVFTEHADHASQILFVEEWLKAQGYEDVEIKEMTPWRREHMSNLINAFDFDHPDFSPAPTFPKTEKPPQDEDGNYIGMETCMDIFGFDPKPLPPFGPENANRNMATLVEEGFKEVNGYLTEGRWLVFEQDGYSITNDGEKNDIYLTEATEDHEQRTQRWMIKALGGGPTEGGHVSEGTYHISSAKDGRFISSHTSLDKSERGAQTYTIKYLGNGKGYSLQKENGKYLSVRDGEIFIGGDVSGWKVYSVNYQS